jgi:hypothetical protein
MPMKADGQRVARQRLMRFSSRRGGSRHASPGEPAPRSSSFSRFTRNVSMKTSIIVVALLLAIGACRLQAQGTFQNLDFEAAQIIFDAPPPNHSIATTNALPGWLAYSGTNQLNGVNYGPGGISFPVALYSTTNGGSLDGKYSVVLGPSGLLGPSGSISQVGLVPSDAQSLLFEGNFTGPITVSLGGQDLSYITISNALNFTLYGAAIPSVFAGQIEKLAFSDGLETGGASFAEIDHIQFSTSAIPEPSTISLIFIGSGVLLYAHKRRWF